MSIVAILTLVWLHFLGDFILQTDKMATGKSKSNKILLIHVAVYSLPLLIIGVEFAIVNLILHFVVDYFTSRATSRLWQRGERHWFFTVIGLDQTLHMTCLVLTYIWLMS